ncbi:MAG: translocation/assembly module TamB [Holophagales bacterium]|jgi:autotransporter translocation and assembly factor TamB|nr:translocation/assembly module TamB [Holophagales bacterium]
MNLASETWNGRITGLADSHILGMTKTPFASAQIEVGLYGSYAANYGSIVLPEGNVILREGQIKIDSNNRLEGLTGNIKVGNGLVLGTVCFQDFLYSDDTLIELDTRKNGNALTGRLNIAFSPETADTAGLAKVLTKGALDNFNLNLTANGRLSDRGLSWRADIDTLSGSAFGLEFGQQILSSLDGNSESIRLAFDLGSRNLDYGVAEPLSRLRVNGTLSLDDAKTADFGFIGTADLEQTRDVLAGVFGGSRDDFLAGFTPIGVGIMDLRLRGPMDTMGLDGVLQIRGGRLQPGGDFPYGIENLNLDLICEGRHIALKNLQGRMARGKLSGFGDIVWNNSGVESYQVQTQLDNFQYNYKPEGFQLDGSLNSLFHSTSDGKGEIKGALKATNMLYASEISLGKIIQENLIGSVPNLQNIEFDDPIDAINLNLDVELTQPWIFDTNLIKIKGMPSEKFKILGTLANPGLLGSIEFAPGGRITNILPAGDIIVEKGSIDFFDSTLMNPVINIQGQIDISPFRVNLNVQGSMDSLNIAPSSTPTLKQDEVISLLLNPAIAPVLGNYSYNNSLTSTATANGLTGAASGLLVNLALLPIQEQIRRTMGLDRVSVALRARTLGSLETDVLIGKSLNLMGKTIPVTGNYTRTSEVTTMGGQMEWRFGNLVIQFGASGSRPAGIAPSGEIRHSWSFW